MMHKITGRQRASLTITWLKRGRPMPLQDFIKAVCKAKGIEYTEPTPIKRELIKKDNGMFPVKD